MHTTPTEIHKAQKRHRCDWCWQFIEPGETYSRYRVYNDGGAATMKLHSECHDAMQEEARQEGGFIEWTPGQERPTPSNAELTGRPALR